MTGKKLRQIIASSVFLLLAGGIFWFMFKNIFADLPLLAAYPWRIKWVFLIYSLCLSVMASVMALKAGHVLSLGLGGEIPFPRFVFIFCISQLSRYLPGRIWPVVGLSLMLEREGVRRSVSIALPFVYQGIMIVVLFLLGLIFCGPAVANKLLHQSGSLVLWISAVLVLTVLCLPVLLRIFGGLSTITVAIENYYGSVFLFLLSGTALSAAFFLFLCSIVSVSPKDAFHLGGSFLLSCVMGWIVLIAPAGLGVREGALAFLLSSVLPAGLSNVVALAARVWMMVAELILLGGVFLVLKMARGRSPSGGLGRERRE